MGLAILPTRPHRATDTAAPGALVRRWAARGCPGLDVLLISCLLTVALAVRWPYLLLLPQFPPVGDPILTAVEVAAGQAAPLADSAPYLGALFIYLLAGVFKLVGPSIQAALALPWLLGAATTIPVYLLGKEIGGRRVGLLAGALLATSGAHTVITSHVPWVHSLTPLLASITLWLLARAARGDGRSLALGGLGAGLSLQSHPTVAPLLLGAAAAVLLRRPAWLRSRWLALALLGVLLGYSTLLAYHLQTRFAVVADIQSKQARYLDVEASDAQPAGPAIYVRNLQLLALSLTRLTSGALAERDAVSDYLKDPWVVGYPLAAAAGLALAARRGSPLLLLAAIPAVLLPPLLNAKYKPVLDGRYLMPLVPVLFVGIALALDGALAAARRIGRQAAPVAVGLAAALIVAHPLALLADYYETSRSEGHDNTPYLQTLAELAAARSSGLPVLLDPRLKEVKTIGGADAGMSFAWLLALDGIPAQTWDGDDDDLQAGQLVVLQRQTAAELADEIDLATPDGRRPSKHDRRNYRAYYVLAAEDPRLEQTETAF